MEGNGERTRIDENPFRSDLLAGRAVLITGGGSGLGLSMAHGCAALGARLAICGRNGERLERAAGALRDAGAEVHTHALDVRDAAAVEHWIALVKERFSRADALINNAAGNFLAPSEELTPNAFDAVVRTVLYGTFNASTAFARAAMAGGHDASILNVVTTYAWTGSAFVVPSAVAKAGVLAMTRSLAVEWAEYDIRVNAVAPGPFPTEGAWQRLMPSEAMEERGRRRVPGGRFGEHDELVNLVAFLLSDAAPYITGECVTIDGGAWMASGGLFNWLTELPREDVKAQLRAMKERAR